MNFEDLSTEKIYRYMPFSGFPHKLLFRFDEPKPCRYEEYSGEYAGSGVIVFSNGCYIVENIWHELLDVCDFLSLLWFNTVDNQLYGFEFYCKKGLLKVFYENFISKDWKVEDGKFKCFYNLSHDGIIFHRKVRYSCYS